MHTDTDHLDEMAMEGSRYFDTKKSSHRRQKAKLRSIHNLLITEVPVTEAASMRIRRQVILDGLLDGQTEGDSETPFSLAAPVFLSVTSRRFVDARHNLDSVFASFPAELRSSALFSDDGGDRFKWKRSSEGEMDDPEYTREDLIDALVPLRGLAEEARILSTFACVNKAAYRAVHHFADERRALSRFSAPEEREMVGLHDLVLTDAVVHLLNTRILEELHVDEVSYLMIMASPGAYPPLTDLDLLAMHRSRGGDMLARMARGCGGGRPLSPDTALTSVGAAWLELRRRLNKRKIPKQAVAVTPDEVAAKVGVDIGASELAKLDLSAPIVELPTELEDIFEIWQRYGDHASQHPLSCLMFPWFKSSHNAALEETFHDFRSALYHNQPPIRRAYSAALIRK
jgi:hypothetical protein